MSFRRTAKYTILTLIFLTLACFCGLAIVYVLLPGILESRIIPGFAGRLGLKEFAAKVREIGLTGADIGPVIIGAENEPAVIVRSVQVDYTLGSLRQVTVKRVVLAGVEVYGAFQDGVFQFRGLDWRELVRQPAAAGTGRAASGAGPLSIPIGRFEIHNAVMALDVGGSTVRVPFDLVATRLDFEQSLVRCTIRLYPAGQLFGVTAELDAARSRLQLSFNAAAAHLSDLCDVFRVFPGLVATGLMDVTGAAVVELSPFNLSSFSTQVQLVDGRIQYGDLTLETVPPSAEGRAATRMAITKADAASWQVSVGAITLPTVVPWQLETAEMRLTAEGGRLTGSGRFRVQTGPFGQTAATEQPWAVLEPWTLAGRIQVSLAADGPWSVQIVQLPEDGAIRKPIKLRWQSNEITAALPQYEIHATGQGSGGSATFKLPFDTIRMTYAGVGIRTPSVSIEGKASWDASDAAATWRLNTGNLQVNSAEAEITIPEVSLVGQLKRRPMMPPGLDATLTWSGGRVVLPAAETKLANLAGEIPLQWPMAVSSQKGTISVGDVSYQDRKLGSISTDLQQTDTGFAFAGRHTNRLLPKLSLQFKGFTDLRTSGFPDTRVEFALSHPEIPTGIPAEKIFPTAEGLVLDGKLDVSGEAKLTSQGFEGSLQASLLRGSVRVAKSKIAVEGIQLNLTVPELGHLRSAPQQVLKFSLASFGTLALDDGQLVFQIESPRSILLEKGQFSWCRGKVDMQSMRIVPGESDYNIILYCDRVNLAEVLRQFGAATADGDGTLNGRIPLRFQKGKLSFDDGFLFSSPGQGGKIEVTGTEMLTAGVPPDTAQYVQMELAREALKSYEYSWAKLNLTTQGEDLLLGLQLDGKPANPLPFTYRKDLGRFVRIEGHAQGAVFQGIRLDVNFRLPLDKLLQYKDILDLMR
jgi:hypothetical protein